LVEVDQLGDVTHGAQFATKTLSVCCVLMPGPGSVDVLSIR